MKLYAIQYVDSKSKDIRCLSNQLYKTKKLACEAAIDIFKTEYDIDDDPDYISQIYDSLYLYDVYVDKDVTHITTYYIIEFEY